MDTLPRDLLAKALGGNPRVVAAFEQQQQQVQDTAEAVSSTAQATDALQDASFITLAPNATLTGERVLRTSGGVTATDDGQHLTIGLNDKVAHVEGGFAVHLTAQGATSLVLPLSGVLATRSGAETLSNKTMASPKLSGLASYANDAAAATGGVPVGGVYHNAGALRVRVA